MKTLDRQKRVSVLVKIKYVKMTVDGGVVTIYKYGDLWYYCHFNSKTIETISLKH